MTSPKQRVDEIQNEYALLYEIETVYAIHRRLPKKNVFEYLKSTPSIVEEIVCIEVDTTTSEYLGTFGYRRITKYCSWTKDYHDDLNLLHKLGIPEGYHPLILILMAKAIWGFPILDGVTIQKIVTPKKQDENQSDPNFENVLGMIGVEFDLRNGDDPEQRSLLEIPVLDKVTFHFKNIPAETIPDKYEIKSLNLEVHPLVEMMGIMIRDQLGDRDMAIHEGRRIMHNLQHESSLVDEQKELPQVQKVQPYQLFCYKFVSFFEDQLSDTPRNQLLRVYHDLLVNAGYGFGSGGNDFGQIEAYFKKWYIAGRGSQVKF